MPIALTDEMRQQLDNAMANRMTCVLATAAPDGTPDIGFKGSIMVYDAEHLAFWERTRGQHLRNMEANPKVAVLFQNTAERIGWRFWGEAEIVRSGDRWQEIMGRVIEAELKADPERLGYAVLIRVDKVVQRGKVIMSRDDSEGAAAD